MIQQETKDYLDAWNAPDIPPPEAPKDEDFTTEFTSMNDRLASGEKLASGDGVSMQTHRAMKEAGVGPYEGKDQPKPAGENYRGPGFFNSQKDYDGKVKMPNGEWGTPEQDRKLREILKRRGPPSLPGSR